ncbi:hypothetical protein AE929_13915 [Xanthomonas arboricola]|nr:hypothetical protein AE920_07525 [Xanthomonas arboricola]KOB14958.1 hypothetical protein AE925_18480 [Xanthomonas arboricola]KOB34855.1 hypothetical protein AE929_13915 [Xanthomonas arboricola]KOB44894.1 hypothetical protein AE931_07230 [Xanthomonas arboricola]OAH84751.1 hypothetical protein AXA70_21075 [Xanthomonas arboricola pv. juglandis]
MAVQWLCPAGASLHNQEKTYCLTLPEYADALMTMLIALSQGRFLELNRVMLAVAVSLPSLTG